MHSRSLSLFLLIAGTACGSGGFAQTSNNPTTPQHPIDTRPEGQGSSCSYSVSRGSGQTTGSSTCPNSDASGAGAAKRFPYPGEDLSLPTPADQKPNTAPNGTQSPQGAAKQFPYPGETGTPGTGSPLKDAGSSGESTSSSSSSSSSAGDLPPDDHTPDSPDVLPTPKRERKKLPPVPRQTPDDREQEDVRVANFYQNDGNYRAAYMRAKDAVTLADDDAEAQFVMAEAARKLGKLDEAQKGYKRCLELDPVPKLRKASEKALKEMAGS